MCHIFVGCGGICVMCEGYCILCVGMWGGCGVHVEFLCLVSVQHVCVLYVMYT